MPPSKKGAPPPPRPPPSLGPPGGLDLPLPEDRRSKALEPLKGVLGERLEALKQIEISEDTLIRGYRAGLFGQAALLALQAGAPGAVPSLWATFIGGPILAGFPPNLVSSFAVLLSLLLWGCYALMHVCQGALLRRTASGFPYSELQVVGLSLVPGYNLYGASVLFGEAAVRLERETHSSGRAGLVKKLVLASIALDVLGWGLLIAAEAGVEIPPEAARGLGILTTLLRLGALGLCFWMMRKLIDNLFDNLDLVARGQDDEDGGALPVPRAPAALSGSAGVTFLVLLVLGVIPVYVVTREELDCGKESSPATTRTPEGKRVLYCAKDGVPHGTWRVRNARGKPELEQTFAGGVLFGPVTLYWPNGRVKEQGSYDQQQKTGPWASYNEAGVRLHQMFYLEGKLHGAFERYHPDGVVAERGAYTNDKLEGPWVAFHPNGKKAEEGKYVAGKKVGRWTTWDKAGLVLGEEDLGGPAPAAGPGSAAAPGAAQSAADAQAAAAELSMREVTQEQLFGGRKVEWWAERLNALKRQADSGQMDGKLYQLTLKRAHANGLTIQDGPELKVGPPGSRVAAAPEPASP